VIRGTLQIVFVLSVAFALYTLLGYPLILALLARFRSRPVRKEYRPKTVTVLLPVRNGEHWLRAKLESLLALDYPSDLLEILVISDGSTDGTDAIAAEFAASGRVQWLRLPQGGKALALNAGLERACGEILFLTDVRQAVTRESLWNLIACFADPQVGVVSGELVIRDGVTREERSVGLYWKYEKWLRKRESRLDSVMGATGCIYALRRELATCLPPGTLADDMFLPLAAFFRGFRVILEESAQAFDYPTGLETEFRRKVRTLAGVCQILQFYPQLLSPRNRMWLAFVSHKLARLLLPYALLAGAATSFALDEPWRTAALLLQAYFYASALFDSWIPDEFPAKRLTAAVRSFVVLLAAAFCAPFMLIQPAQKLWEETRVRSARSLP
jgi:poly-beta-1,6-N-acetyl-D-glucosamine synthase